MNEGYLYCMSNESMPGMFKIGMTDRTPEERLREANISDTWRPPTDYKIELAKKVSNASQKEKTIHKLLEQNNKRINPRREFFRVSIEEVRTIFDLMDGEMWVETNIEDEDDISQLNDNPDKGCRDMTKCFTHGQRIRHVIDKDKVWIGTYDSSNNVIVCDNKFYKSLSGMASEHKKTERSPLLANTANGWLECECEVDGSWKSTFSLPG